MTSRFPLRLRIQQIETVCTFELAWGYGQHISATLPYPAQLTSLYQEWHRSYLNFYKSLNRAIQPSPEADNDSSLRGRAVSTGNFAAPMVDWHRQLVQAEAKLLDAFHHWLRSAELFDIRSTIAQQRRQLTEPHLDLFLTCTPLEMARFPWETWDLGQEFGLSDSIRIVRAPANIHADAAVTHVRRMKPRILVILGDNTGLDFQVEQTAVRSLNRLANVHFIHWQVGQSATDWKAKICHTIADPKGWDILFFAGHSNESASTGGEISIAPGVAIAIRELAPHLQTAKVNGLRFALFNSCSGLHLAESLIDLGLSQVAVMREPIHNQVAQVFLAQFLAALAGHNDVHDALLAACTHLRHQQNLAYPSASLVPSLFRHPGSTLFQLQPIGWKKRLVNFAPKPWEAVAIALLLGISWPLPVQSWLTHQRLLTQSVYRHVTQQIPQTAPPILLVQIDNPSLIADGISNPRPIDRTYLARLIDQAAQLEINVIGLDYVLDRPQAEADPILDQSVKMATKEHGAWLIQAAVKDDTGTWLPIGSEATQQDEKWFGDIRMWGEGLYVPILPRSPKPLPLGHLMALAHQLRGEQPDLSPSAFAQMTQTDQNIQIAQTLSSRAVLSDITLWSYAWKQFWLQPITDFSIPPQQVYQRIPSAQFLRLSPADFEQQYGQRTILIMPGGYEEAGVDAMGADNLSLPPATRYWRQAQNPPDPRWLMPGGEVHAYIMSGLLNHKLIVPLPDLWLVGLFLVLGKAIAVYIERDPTHRHRWRMITVAGLGTYGLFSLQLFVSAGILLPWLLPSLAMGLYVFPLPPFQRKTYG
ncbi:MAG: CHASE2 domain-containing protein [Thainema sp.]